MGRFKGTKFHAVVHGFLVLLGVSAPELARGQCDPPQVAKLTDVEAAMGDLYGVSVACSGITTIVGAMGDDEVGTDSGSAYILDGRLGGFWQQIAKLTASDAAAGDHFGISVSISGDTAMVGAYKDDDKWNESGSAYVFREVGGVWQQIAKLTADDGAEGDHFGISVSISGGTAVVGANLDDHGDSNRGSAYVFREVGGVWQQIAKLTADDGVEADNFGVSVSISGGTVIIGASLDNDGGFDSGSVYFFREVGGVWQQVAKRVPTDPAALDEFGTSVFISGNTAIVGSYLDNHNAGTDSGSAYIFREVGGVWQQIAKLTAADASAFANFGKSVSTNGNMAAIGAPLHAGLGSAYVFQEIGGIWQQVSQRNADDPDDQLGYSVSIIGNTWVAGAWRDESAGADSGSVTFWDQLGNVNKLTASDAVENDRFGSSVSMSGDTALIGAPYDEVVGNESGSVYVIRKIGGVWEKIAKLTSYDVGGLDDGYLSNRFGSSVSISEDTAVIGAPTLDFGDGSAYVFKEINGVWQQIAELITDEVNANDQFGSSVSIDGNTAIVGAPFDDVGGSQAGAAYIFREIGGVWQQVARLTASDPEIGDQFGTSVAINGDTAVIGVPFDEAAGSNSGAGYIFREVGGVWQQVAKLSPEDAAAFDNFGQSVALRGDTAFFGAPRDNSNGTDSGSVYVFGDVGGKWLEIAELVAFDPQPDNKRFGTSVSVHGDMAVFGAIQDDVGGGDSGAAYYFREIGGNWQQVAKLKAADPQTLDRFGISVAINEEAIIVGAYFDDDGGNQAGSAYVFGDLDCDGDTDGDGIPDEQDNCPFIPNQEQANLDGDSEGDACDGDIDADGILNDNDACPINPPWVAVDFEGRPRVDLDGDCDGDLADWARFQNDFTGPNP